ncbi:30S ribosome-binding factor RbfA [Pseudobdellovibrio sp. HCB154]|uniref:30S ribosome-binding factor RbfA n=1 Tax=Pseudobdellovibrio sp. HCB154 TaxID=3386277 RepID=UPI003917510C
MKNMGDGRRVARVEREVQSVISTFIISRLQRELPGLITVARVQIPADLRQARVYVSLLQTNVEDLQSATQGKVLAEAVKILQSWAPEIQDEIGNKLNMKYLPKLTFFADESTEKILRVEKIISEISKNPSKAESLDDDDDFEDEEN